MKKISDLALRPYIFALFFLLLVSMSSFAKQPAHYPIPPDTENRLFYLQRSTSIHTVIYDANILANGQLNPKNPVNVYWLRYDKNKNSKRRALNFAERNFAYGITIKKLKPGTFKMNLKAYSERDIQVYINKVGQPIAQTIINNRSAMLKSVYVDVSGSGIWINVNYIELIGMGLKDGKLEIERVFPNQEND